MRYIPIAEYFKKLVDKYSLKDVKRISFITDKKMDKVKAQVEIETEDIIIVFLDTDEEIKEELLGQQAYVLALRKIQYFDEKPSIQVELYTTAKTPIEYDDLFGEIKDIPNGLYLPLNITLVFNCTGQLLKEV